jgi:putative oxidoreductase
LLKNVAIAGGLLCLCAANTMRWSYDSMRDQRRVERAERESAMRAAVAEGKLEERDAALRVAEAEGRVRGPRLG